MDMNALLMMGFRMIAAFVIALPVAWERERSTRIMGLRTFPLVAMGSCGYVLVSLGVTEAGDADAHARVIQGLMTGIGFLGGGAILKEGISVKGTATAASVWSTGAIGGAAGFGEYPVAVMIGLANYLTLRLLTPLQGEE